jgi:hypothetical protein
MVNAQLLKLLNAGMRHMDKTNHWPKKAWTSANSFVCLNVAQGANCRDGTSKESVTFASLTNPNKWAWTIAADAKCLEPITANCRNRGTGISEAYGIKARTSSAD